MTSIGTEANKELEAEFEKNKEKFKLLYEIASQEYKDEFERATTIDTKINSVFTILNVMLTLLVALTANQQFINLYSILCAYIKLIIILCMFFIFIFLLLAWFQLFNLMGNNKIIKKIDLKINNQFEDTVYNDSEDINYFYFLLYKTYQTAIDANASLTNVSFKSLEVAFNYIRIAFVIICITTIILYMSFLNQGVIK